MSRRLLRPLVAAVVYCAAAALAPHTAHAQLKAFPQAEGYGANALGGRGGDVYHVTKLNDDGSFGTLRHGIENAPSAGRTIVFDVSGYITLNSKLGITRDNITIAGQTAPGGGIGIKGNQVSVGADNVVMRHVRLRPGKSAGRVDSLSISSGRNVIFDHISAGFSYDENASANALTRGGVANLTLQHSSIAYGLEDHSAGSLIQNSNNLSYHHNLYAHNHTRNPKARVEGDGIEWLGNVAYDYNNGFIAGDSSTTDYFWKATFDRNTYITGPGDTGRPMIKDGEVQNYGLYFGTNAYDNDGDAAHDPTDYTGNGVNASGLGGVVSGGYTWSATPYGSSGVWVEATTQAAYERVLAQFGATPWNRDEVDTLLHSNVVNRQGALIDREGDLDTNPDSGEYTLDDVISNGGFGTLAAGVGPTDSDGDGIPNAWEERHGTNPFVASNNDDFDLDGYTDLEEYLNELAAFQAPGTLEFSGIGRFADSLRWLHRWQPTHLDDAVIKGRAFVDAVGQRAGSLAVEHDGAAAGRLYVTSGWLEVAAGLSVDALSGGGVQQYGGEVLVESGSVDIASGGYYLRGGALTTPQITRQAAAEFEFTGGLLDVGVIDFDLQIEGGVLAPGVDQIDDTTIDGDLTIDSGGVVIDLASISQADLVQVTGDVALGGSLDVNLLGSFSPTAGLGWLIMTGDSITGNFDSITAGYSTVNSGTALWLTSDSPAQANAAPEPAGLALLLLAGALLATTAGNRRAAIAAVVLLAPLSVAQQADAVIVAAGELIVDLRATDLDSNSNTWANEDTSGATVGNFTTVGGGGLNVASVGGVTKALNINSQQSNALLSSGSVPSSVTGNNTRSVEAWVYANTLASSQSAVSWGSTGTDQFSRFSYATGSNGLFSGWFNDAGWGGATPPTGEWTHVAWTWDGSLVRGYLNGELRAATPVNGSGTLATTSTIVTIGAGRTGANADFFDGYLGDIRVHTGRLTDAEVLNNYQHGLAVGPSGVAGDYSNDGVVDAADYTVWRDAAANATLMNEEVSPFASDIADYLYWTERYGATDSGAPAPVAGAVPEPAGILLLAAFALPTALTRTKSRERR